MNYFIIKRENVYVTTAGLSDGKSYTKNILQAKLFASIAEAETWKCSNEHIVHLMDEFLDFHS